MKDKEKLIRIEDAFGLRSLSITVGVGLDSILTGVIRITMATSSDIL